MPRLDRYQDPKVYEALAGDFVLGTMGGRARQRFLELIAARGYVREAVTAWERRLNPLGTHVVPIAPHPRVWRKIRREIGSAEKPRSEPFWNSLWLWRATACVAVLALAGLVFFRVTPLPVAPIPTYVAVLVDEQQAPMIVATATRDPRRLTILMMQESKLGAQADLELWAVPGSGDAPISLGLLSKDQETLIELDARELQIMPATGAFAISREPKGGSPTGAPTGPVVYQGKLVTL